MCATACVAKEIPQEDEVTDRSRYSSDQGSGNEALIMKGSSAAIARCSVGPVDQRRDKHLLGPREKQPSAVQVT